LPLVIPVTEFDPRGNGCVYDFRNHAPGDVVSPVDFNQPVRTKFDTAFLARALVTFPDRELVTFLCRGVALKTESAPPDLVLCPHLVSLNAGVADAAKTVRAHAARSAYGIFERGLALPRRGLGQGSTPKRDGTGRRTTDGGGPRKNKNVKSLNEASKEAPWVGEIKPTLDDLSNDMAVLLHAGGVLGLKLYQLTDDFKFFFNQLALHPSQWHLTTFLWLSSLEEDAVPAHVMEYVLGFGLSPSSNVAQRFADAIMWLLRRRVDKEDAALRAADPDPEHQAYFKERAALGPGQDRLITARCYTDESHFFALGVDRALCVLRHWGDLTAKIWVEMASFDKRQAGGVVNWLGVLSNSAVGTLVVPQDKTLRALLTLGALVEPTATVLFKKHRKLMGLLEHIVGVVHARRLDTYGMYDPRRRLGGDPEGAVHLPELGLRKARAWIVALLATPGRHSHANLAAACAADRPHALDAMGRRFLIFTDAAKEGAAVPSLGGWCHGFYFSLPIPAGLRGYPIPKLELLGMLCGVFVFADATRGGRTDLDSDSDTSVEVPLNDGAHCLEMQWIHAEFVLANSLLGTVDNTCHAHGEINVPADMASRGHLTELRELSAQLRVRPSRLGVPAAFLDVLYRFEAEFGTRPTGGAPMPPRAQSAAELELIQARQRERSDNEDRDKVSISPPHLSARPRPLERSRQQSPS
jgi:hypothetical protein